MVSDSTELSDSALGRIPPILEVPVKSPAASVRAFVCLFLVDSAAVKLLCAGVGRPLCVGNDGPSVHGLGCEAGSGWGVAGCAVNAYLAYLPMFFPDLDLSPYPAVQATIAATQERPAYRKVMGLD